MNKFIIDTIKSCSSTNDLKKIASHYGYNLSDEQIKNYFELFHKTGEVTEKELDNVSGAGQCYSSEPHGYLIVVPGFNDCDGFEHKENPSGFDNICDNCRYLTDGPGAVHYCTLRTKYKDDFKK